MVILCQVELHFPRSCGRCCAMSSFLFFCLAPPRFASVAFVISRVNRDERAGTAESPGDTRRSFFARCRALTFNAPIGSFCFTDRELKTVPNHFFLPMNYRLSSNHPPFVERSTNCTRRLAILPLEFDYGIN